MEGERLLASEAATSISSIRELAPASLNDVPIKARISTSLKNLLLYL